MKNLAPLIALAAVVTACSHPLEIEGAGDILSASGDRDCLLEDFQAAQDNCTENLVALAYLETYFAQPRPGWQFDRWVNYCEDAPANECSFDIPAGAVQQFWGETVPPLRAVFTHSPPPAFSALNDTGIVFGVGEFPSGNNPGCTGVIIAQQDCSNGRDATNNDDSDGNAGFSYTKLADDGTKLPASATSWSCVQDSVTGLVWEVKTDDGGIHDKDNTYRWGGKTVQGTGFGNYFPDWDVLVDGTNGELLCGFSDWRVPSTVELEGLANFNRFSPAIDIDYFPNTAASNFWSSSPSADGSSFAWVVGFNNGDAFSGDNRDGGRHVRLVRAGQ